MANRILVPLDGSPLAEQALSCAAMLGQALPSELVLFHAVAVPPDDREILGKAGVEPAAVLEELEAKARDYLYELVGQLAEQRLNARYAIERGPAAEMILEYVEEMDVQQIVMATHGYSGIKRWTHGSVAERVLQAARVPVLMVRAQEQDAEAGWQIGLECKRILVPLDGSRTAEQVLPAATMAARALNSELILFQVPIVHVYGWLASEWFLPVPGVLATAEDDATAYLADIAASLKDENVRVRTAMGIGPVAFSIVEYAEANNVDLIAMCTHGRSGLARWTLGSVADHVLRSGSKPILLVRAT